MAEVDDDDEEEEDDEEYGKEGKLSAYFIKSTWRSY
jgi:hypothetical protein